MSVTTYHVPNPTFPETKHLLTYPRQMDFSIERLFPNSNTNRIILEATQSEIDALKKDIKKSQSYYSQFITDIKYKQSINKDILSGINSNLNTASTELASIINIPGNGIPPLPLYNTNLQFHHSIKLNSLIIIPEDSTLQKILSLIPVIGEYFAYKNETSLEAKIQAEQNIEVKNLLLRVKKCYKGIAVARTIMSVALSFFAAPYTLIPLIVKVSSTILGAARSAKAIYDIYKINTDRKSQI